MNRKQIEQLTDQINCCVEAGTPLDPGTLSNLLAMDGFDTGPDRCFDLLVELVKYRCTIDDQKLYTFEPDFADIIRYLAERGACTITYDKRGVVYATIN